MSLKQELQAWVAALALYDRNELEEAIVAFQPIADTSKILFNCGLICASLGAHKDAVGYYDRAVTLDRYLAVAYFQRGVSNFLQEKFEDALTDFNNTLTYMRGNKWIDYDQLGLKHKLWSCEARFNRGLCYFYLQDMGIGMHDLVAACREKGSPTHDVIDEAIRDNAEGYLVFSIPAGCIFRPNEAKTRNIMARDYLGKARLVASSSTPSRGSSGHLSTTSGTSGRISADSSNLKSTPRPSTSVRSRQRSEPPLSRKDLPTILPTELNNVRSSVSLTEPMTGDMRRSGRSQSVGRRPSNLKLGVAAFSRTATPAQPRSGAERSASERPAGRRVFGGNAAAGSQSPHYGGVAVENARAIFHADHDQQRNSENRSKGAATGRPVSVEEEAEDERFAEVRTPRSLIDRIVDGKRIDRLGTPLRSTTPTATALLRRVRLKVHFCDDTHFLVVSPTVNFLEFVDAIRLKLGTKNELKLKCRDEEGDLITIADQEDLEVAISTCRELALKEGRDMGKLELWVHEASSSSNDSQVMK